MKKVFVFVLLSIAVLVFAASCNRGSSDVKKQPTMQESNTQVYYTCTMHPEVRSEQPGKCPKCGMELVKKEVAASDSIDMQVRSDSM